MKAFVFIQNNGNAVVAVPSPISTGVGEVIILLSRLHLLLTSWHSCHAIIVVISLESKAMREEAGILSFISCPSLMSTCWCNAVVVVALCASTLSNCILCLVSCVLCLVYCFVCLVSSVNTAKKTMTGLALKVHLLPYWEFLKVKQCHYCCHWSLDDNQWCYKMFPAKWPLVLSMDSSNGNFSHFQLPL